MDSNNLPPKPLGWFFIAFGILFPGLAIYWLWEAIHFASSAERAEGVVTRLVSDGDAYRPVVAFNAGPRRVEFQGQIGTSPPAFKVGEKVTVLFLADKPEEARIQAFSQQFLLPLAFGGGGGVFGIVGLVILICHARQARRWCQAVEPDLKEPRRAGEFQVSESGPRLPAEIVVVRIDDGVRYVLPRPAEWGTAVGCVASVFLAAALLFGYLGLLFLFGPMGSLFDAGGQNIDPMAIVVGLVGIPLLVVACLSLRMAILILAGHNEIELRRDRLCAVARLGPITRTKWRPTQSIARFVVGRQTLQRARPGEKPGRLSLKAECEDFEALELACDQPLEWLLAVAHDLAARWDRIAHRRGREREQPQVIVVES